MLGSNHHLGQLLVIRILVSDQSYDNIIIQNLRVFLGKDLQHLVVHRGGDTEDVYVKQVFGDIQFDCVVLKKES